ncbi:MAG TPA: hypothetical protein V6C95_07775 [Coleofasciculaceae cyanobacterium]
MSGVSDWAILNDTRAKQLKRILSEFYHLSDSEIHLACVLLESYQAVYRRDRLEQRRIQSMLAEGRIQERCLPPTDTQLHEITQRVNAKIAISIKTEEISTQLQNLAQHLRHYCRYVRKHLRTGQFLDESKNGVKCDRIQSEEATHNGHVAFVQLYAM